MPERTLQLTLHRFPVDGGLLNLPVDLFSEVRGEVFADLRERRVFLSLLSDSLIYKDFSFGRATLQLDYSYGKREGELQLRLSEPGNLRLEGNLEGGSFFGEMSAEGVPFRFGEAFAVLSYTGKLLYTNRTLELVGSGSFMDLRWRELKLGRGGYALRLKGREIDLTFWGDGVSGRIVGNTEEGFLSELDFSGFRVSRREAELSIEEGVGEVFWKGKKRKVNLRITSGSFRTDWFRTRLSGDLSLGLPERKGTFSFGLSGFELKGKELGDGRVEGRIEGRFARGKVHLKRAGSGSFELDLDKFSFSFKGSYLIGGDRMPVKVEGSLRGEEIKLTIESFTYRKGVLELSFGGAEVKGNLNDAVLLLRGGRVDLLGDTVLSLERSEGELKLKERRLSLKGSYRGSAEGELSLEVKGLSPEVSLLGRADLGRLSFLVSSFLGGRLEGSVTYRLHFKKGKLSAKVNSEMGSLLLSRYLQTPMRLGIDLRAEGRSLAAFITLWSEGKGLSANVGTKDLKNYYVYILSKELPLSYEGEGLEAKMEVSGNGWLKVRELESLSLHMDLDLKGELRIKGRRTVQARKFPNVKLHLNLRSKEPLRITLPEGYLYAYVRGKAEGTLNDLRYDLDLLLLSGELTYFGRKFYVRRGTMKLVRTERESKKFVDMDLVSSTDDTTIHLNVRGDLSDPDVFVWSEPPKSVGEIVASLIGGGSGEGVIPVSEVLFKNLGYEKLGGELISALGIDLSVSTKTGSGGEMGVNLNVKKKISRFFSVEYQQSTLRDPRETYYGGGVRLPGNLTLFGRVFSDDVSEVKLRFIRKFDF